jgi:predicted kinase
MKTKIILMRGISGSGKSTHLSKLTSVNSVVCSADHHFMVDGVYKFDAAQLAKAHRLCFRKFIDTLTTHAADPYLCCDVLAVDNTHLTAWEIAPYVATANAFGIRPEIITVTCDVDVAHRRNAHGVPEATIARMSATLNKERLPTFWDVDFRYYVDFRYVKGE